eukprot:5762-Heterococcus_DN1.PRE.4
MVGLCLGGLCGNIGLAQCPCTIGMLRRSDVRQHLLSLLLSVRLALNATPRIHGVFAASQRLRKLAVPTTSSSSSSSSTSTGIASSTLQQQQQAAAVHKQQQYLLTLHAAQKACGAPQRVTQRALSKAVHLCPDKPQLWQAVAAALVSGVTSSAPSASASASGTGAALSDGERIVMIIHNTLAQHGYEHCRGRCCLLIQASIASLNRA